MFHQIVTSDNPQPIDGTLNQETYAEPTSPDAAKSRQIAQETWRRQAEDVLKRQQVMQEKQNGQPMSMGKSLLMVLKHIGISINYLDNNPQCRGSIHIWVICTFLQVDTTLLTEERKQVDMAYRALIMTLQG